MGYSQGELDDAQARWDLCFPPDLVELLREHRPPFCGPRAIDWVLTEPDQIREMLDWPLEGFLFYVEHNGVRWTDWGDRPDNPGDRYDRLLEIFAAAPKLIPVYGHRYLPSAPFEPGNPILSVYQTDVICYGANLLDWLDRERNGWSSKPWEGVHIKKSLSG